MAAQPQVYPRPELLTNGFVTEIPARDPDEEMSLGQVRHPNLREEFAIAKRKWRLETQKALRRGPKGGGKRGRNVALKKPNEPAWDLIVTWNTDEPPELEGIAKEVLKGVAVVAALDKVTRKDLDDFVFSTQAGSDSMALSVGSTASATNSLSARTGSVASKGTACTPRAAGSIAAPAVPPDERHWSELPEDLPVGCLKPYTVPETDQRMKLRGAQGVKTRLAVPAGYVFGPYRSYCLLMSDYGILTRRGKPANAEFTDEDTEWRIRLESYGVDEGNIFLGDTPAKVMFSGYGYGNETCLVNDPHVDPVHHMRMDEDMGPKITDDDGNQLSGNCLAILVNIMGWPYAFLVAIKGMVAGTELRYEYGAGYWSTIMLQHNLLVAQQSAEKQVQHLQCAMQDLHVELAAKQQRIEEHQRMHAELLREVRQLRELVRQLQLQPRAPLVDEVVTSPLQPKRGAAAADGGGSAPRSPRALEAPADGSCAPDVGGSGTAAAAAAGGYAAMEASVTPAARADSGVAHAQLPQPEGAAAPAGSCVSMSIGHDDGEAGNDVESEVHPTVVQRALAPLLFMELAPDRVRQMEARLAQLHMESEAKITGKTAGGVLGLIADPELLKVARGYEMELTRRLYIFPMGLRVSKLPKMPVELEKYYSQWYFLQQRRQLFDVGASRPGPNTTVMLTDEWREEAPAEMRRLGISFQETGQKHKYERMPKRPKPVTLMPRAAPPQQQPPPPLPCFACDRACGRDHVGDGERGAGSGGTCDRGRCSERDGERAGGGAYDRARDGDRGGQGGTSGSRKDGRGEGDSARRRDGSCSGDDGGRRDRRQQQQQPRWAAPVPPPPGVSSSGSDCSSEPEASGVRAASRAASPRNGHDRQRDSDRNRRGGHACDSAEWRHGSDARDSAEERRRDGGRDGQQRTGGHDRGLGLDHGAPHHDSSGGDRRRAGENGVRVPPHSGSSSGDGGGQREGRGQAQQQRPAPQRPARPGGWTLPVPPPPCMSSSGSDDSSEEEDGEVAASGDCSGDC